MRGVYQVLVGMALGCGAWGCRTATRVVEEPRVDLELSGGNRGYLTGTPPATPVTRSTTRQVVETEIEVPSFSKPHRPSAGPVRLEEPVGTTVRIEEETGSGDEGLPGAFDSYVVRRGETLWSIAAKPEVFGRASRWRALYEANRDLLKSPDRLRAGMTLRIPRGGGESSAEEPARERTTFVK